MVKIFVNGTFDVLHPGHIQLLNYAKSLGDYLCVAIDADKRVKELKGYSRPILNEADRSFMLMNLKPVDKVLIFNSDETLINIIKSYEPDFMVIGSDYRDKKVIGSEYAKELRFFERDNKYSTTKVLKNSTYR